MIYDVAKSLHEGHGIEQGLYDAAVALLGERGVVEVIGLCGYYALVSMTLNAFEFGLPEGEVSELS
jgi:4-carboxymuconolactone decarboxylase